MQEITGKMEPINACRLLVEIMPHLLHTSDKRKGKEKTSINILFIKNDHPGMCSAFIVLNARNDDIDCSKTSL